MRTASRKRVVLVGAGHAHLHTLKRAAAFRQRGHELIVVAPDLFWYSGLATGMLGGCYPPELDQVDVAALTERGGGRFIRDRVTGIDPQFRLVHLQGGPPLPYDVLSLTLGSEPPTIDGTANDPCCYTVKPIRRLLQLREDLEARFAATPAHAPRVVVAGGGVTACELSANILALAAARGGRVHLTVLTGRGEALAQLPPRPRARVLGSLTQRGVTFRTGSRVERVEAGRAVLTDGGTLPYDIFLNATGLKPHRLIREIGLPVDRDGALLVDRHLRSVGDPAILGGGDGVAYQGRELPKVGVYAIRQAPVLFRNLLATLEGDEPTVFTPQRHFLWIMNLGDGTGLAVRNRLWWHGRAAFRLKDRIDRRFMREYQEAVAAA